MDFEVDHVFITVSAGAREMEALVAAGFKEGPPNEHSGQGTACRRIFFENRYLELIWLEDVSKATAPNLERAGLMPRVRRVEGVSRLGIGLRPADDSQPVLPVRTWPYRPPYLAEGTAIAIAENSRVLHEPLLFFMSSRPEETASYGEHPNGARRVTDIRVMLTHRRNPRSGLPVRSSELEWLMTENCLAVEWGDGELLTLELDHGDQGETLALGPSVPLRLKW